MFRLATPITCARPVSDFDDISTILTHSSLTGSQKAAPWQQHVGEDGQLFYVELNHAKPPPSSTPRHADTGATCALCSTRSCHSCASEDTGYSSDTDALPTQLRGHRSEQAALDLSSDSLFNNSRVPDTEDKDDGVSVDLQDFDRADLTSSQLCEDEEGSTPLALRGHATKSASRTRHRHSCTRTASLCERHSNKLYAPESSSSNCGSERRTCNCGGQSVSMSWSRTKPQEAGKEVVLHLRPTEWPWDGQCDRVGWLEAALGIVPGCGDAGGAQKQDNTDSGRIVISALLPDGPAARSKKVFTGDCIQSINGKQVRWNNLNLVISALHHTKKVRLAVSRPASTHTDSSTCLLLDTGSVLHALQDTLSPSPARPSRGGEGLEGVCIVYMSMEGAGSGEGEEGGERRDVLYQFPKEEGVVSSLRGAFYTLDHLLSDGAMDSDVRMLTVAVDGCDINVACHKEGRDMLIITSPGSRLQSSQLLTISNEILRLVRLLYGSVEEAFSTERNHSSLDDFLSFVFTMLPANIRGQHNRWQPPLLGYLDYLPLPEDIGISIGNTLTEFESADFADMSDSFYGCRRSFTVLGSMAFYKGHVTCCHLPPTDAGDVGVYLKHSGLLHLSTRHPLHQVLVWREVFPTRLCQEVAALNSVFGYSEPHARWFLMVVGVNNTLLACVLEAGGCSAQHEGTRLPDPFYVDQARAALLHLQTADIISACKIRLSGDGLPATATADHLLSHIHMPLEPNHKALDGFLKTTSSLVHSLHNTHLTSGVIPRASGGRGSCQGARGLWKEHRKMSVESDGSSGSASSNEGMFKNHVRRGRLFPLPSHNTLVHKTAVVLDSDINTCKVNSGKGNKLLMFCQVNEQEGVLITSPVDSTSGSGAGSVHRQVVDNFHRCVTQMHADFALTANAKVYPGEGVLEDIQGDHSWRSCREEGVMFTCSLPDKADTKRSSPHCLLYWVVGRKFKNLHSQEVYVCFQDSTPQNIIEVAFRLALGSSSFP
ncbi:protein inturned-like [Babylonia areolata]|uniref:protein inturned-like n=1 Tax=Babylonia areolata TaxID=304850 RepID=UPI003FCF1D98